MFLGTHTPRLDDKGRLILPAKFRDELAGGVVITKGQERCLYVFPDAEFGRIAEQLRATPMTHKAARAYSRVFFASAHDEVPDRQGRVTIPGHLREYAGLDRELVVIGASTRVEIWDTAGLGDLPRRKRRRLRRHRGGGAAGRAVRATSCRQPGRRTAVPRALQPLRAPDATSPVPGAMIWRRAATRLGDGAGSATWRT